MHKSLLDLLVDPVSKGPLRFEGSHGTADGDIQAGRLLAGKGDAYPIIEGIPRFVGGEDRDQRLTGDSFGFKWRQRESYDSPRAHASAREWLVARYGFSTAEDMRAFFSSRGRVLDAGCGSGFSTSLWMEPGWQAGGRAEWYGVEISEAVDVALGRLGHMPGTHFVQADILWLPFRDGTFDTIFSEGVLHHTPSTERALKALIPLLEPGGQIMFYVYRKKAPVREFTDDHVRGLISSLPPREAWEALRALTQLGRALAELRAEVDVREDVPLLGIKAGRYDVQRLIYWHFAKLFWNDSLSFEENHHINFDWYHPRYAHRHTEDEVRRWCGEAGLSIVHLDSQESGFTVRADKV